MEDFELVRALNIIDSTLIEQDKIENQFSTYRKWDRQLDEFFFLWNKIMNNLYLDIIIMR